MTRVLVPLAHGCEELEAVTVIDLLRRAEIDVTTAGLTAGAVTASRGTVLLPDTTLDAVVGEAFDMIVLPGGLPGARYLEEDARLRAMLLRQQAAGRFLAAICAAPRVLAAAGLLDGRRATCYPGAIDPAAFPLVQLTAAPVMLDGTLITGRGPGTALDFALQLIESLAGRATRDRVELGLVREPG